MWPSSSHRVFENAGELRAIVNAWQKRTHKILGEEATPLEVVRARGQETADPPGEKRGMPFETRNCIRVLFFHQLGCDQSPSDGSSVTSNDYSQTAALTPSGCDSIPYGTGATRATSDSTGRSQTETRLTSATCRDVFARANCARTSERMPRSCPLWA
jgi:hypothetical protein